jgi:hypothetical protein
VSRTMIAERTTKSVPAVTPMTSGSNGSGTPKPSSRGLLCRIGIHFGEWKYIAADGCRQFRVCRHCGKVTPRMRHVRQWEYVRERRCEQVKVCARCREPGRSRTSHQWGPSYQSGTWYSREQTHECYRCGKTETWQVSSSG